MESFSWLCIVLALGASQLSPSMAQFGLCSAPHGDFPNPSSELCTTFFRCFHGNPTLLRCPVNQRFDFLFRICRPQRLVDCRSQLETYSTLAAVSGAGGFKPGPSPFVDSGEFGGLGGLSGGLNNQGLLGFLTRLGEGDEGQLDSGGELDTWLLMSALMNQRKAVTKQDVLRQSAPLTQLHPAHASMPLTLLTEPEDELTNQRFQPMGSMYGQAATEVGFGGKGQLPEGKTVIVIPQYIPVMSQTDQAWGQKGQFWGQGQSDSSFPGSYNTDSFSDVVSNIPTGQGQDTPTIQDFSKFPAVSRGQTQDQGQNQGAVFVSDQRTSTTPEVQVQPTPHRQGGITDEPPLHPLNSDTSSFRQGILGGRGLRTPQGFGGRRVGVRGLGQRQYMHSKPDDLWPKTLDRPDPVNNTTSAVVNV